jgi:hypothetical protein
MNAPLNKKMLNIKRAKIRFEQIKEMNFIYFNLIIVINI